MTTKSHLATLFDRAWRGAEQRRWQRGRLGRRNADSTTTIAITDRPGWVYVTMGPSGDGSLTVARNVGNVPLRPGLPVRLRREQGVLCVMEADYVSGLLEGDVDDYGEYGVPPHIHDDRYFREDEHLSVSAGAGDAGKPVVLDSGGHVDASMINDADVNLDNVTEGTTNKFFTATDKARLANTSGTNTGDQVVPANTTATSGQYFSAYNSTTGAFTKAQPNHTALSNIGTNTHAQIDTHIASTSNPHSVTKSQVGLGSVDNVQQMPLSYLDTDGTLAANSDAKVASQKAVKTYADALVAAANALVYKGVIDCSGNPNYPAADAGHLYVVSVAGKIGGASGASVDVGDLVLCNTDSTASGDQATVGTKWNVVEKNLVGAVTGPASAVDGNLALFDGTTGKVIKAGNPPPANTPAVTNQFVTAYNASTGAYSQAQPDHGSVAGLTDDDHSQYARLAGRSGGQTLQGGTAAGDDLTLESTSHATKGTIFLGSQVVIDDANGRMGFGTTAPGSRVELASPGGPYLTLTRDDTSVTAGDVIGRIRFRTTDTDTTTNEIAAEIEGQAVSTIGSDINPGRIIFRTTGSTAGAAVTERARITQDGFLDLQAGDSSGVEARVGGVMYKAYTSVGNVGTGDDTLHSYSVPASTLAVNGDALHFEAYGSFADSGNTKRVRAYFGATLIADSGASVAANTDWHLTGLVVRTGAATQRACSDYRDDAGRDGILSAAAPAETLSNAITLKITGETNAAANNEVVCTFFRVWWEPNNT